MAHTDTEMDAVLDEHGNAAYGVWWLLLEDIAAPMEVGKMVPSATHSIVKWASICRGSVRGVQSIFKSLSDHRLIVMQSTDNRITISVPNILKYKDEYSKKSGHTPDQIEIEKQKEREKETTPKEHAADAAFGVAPSPRPKRDDTTAWFTDEFWPLWPVKENKPPAQRAASKLSPSERAAALAAMPTWIPRILAMDRPIHASTWINGRRWEDSLPLLFVSNNVPQRKEGIAESMQRTVTERLARGERPF